MTSEHANAGQDERRERYADAIWQAVKADRSDPSEGPDAYLNALADAAMAVADEELAEGLVEYAEDAQQRAFQAEENAGRLAAAQTEVDRLTARVAELERPAREKARNEIRQSYRALAAQASEDGDYENEAAALQRLTDREAQWSAVDRRGDR